MVEEARKLEVVVVDKIGVWHVVHRLANTNVTGTRRVDKNKGDKKSTLVPFPRGGEGLSECTVVDLLAVMPPMTAINIFLAVLVTDVLLRCFGRQGCTLLEPGLPTLHVELPDGLNLGPLNRSMFGCRDAGHNWVLETARVMMMLEFVQGSSSPCT